MSVQYVVYLRHLRRDRMIRTLLSIPLLALTAMPLSSEGDCDRAYVLFMDSVGSAPVADGKRLADFHRRALRIFYACDSGHMQKPEIVFQQLKEEVGRSL